MNICAKNRSISRPTHHEVGHSENYTDDTCDDSNDDADDDGSFHSPSSIAGVGRGSGVAGSSSRGEAAEGRGVGRRVRAHGWDGRAQARLLLCWLALMQAIRNAFP